MTNPDATPSAPAPDTGCVVDVPYLLAMNAGLIRAEDGSLWWDRSLAKDLLRVADYVPQLTYVAPIRRVKPDPLDVPMTHPGIRVVGFDYGGGRLSFAVAMLKLAAILLRELPKTRIVHSCVAGYPWPVGWVVIPLARLYGKKIVVTVESSFWRIPAGRKASTGQRLNAWVWERMNRWCMRQVDYAAYPHDEYRRSLPSPRAGGGVLFQASWIDPKAILSEAEVRERWDARVASGRLARFLFATRMVVDKGPRVLAEAIRRLGGRGADMTIDILGEGAERETLAAAATSSDWARAHVRLLDPVPYGPDFFRLLTDYDAILSPILSDEQPRIVYDGYSMGVPSIASDMPGLVACVEDGVSGRIVAAADAAGLADAMTALAADPEQARRLALGAREAATRFTHDRMHDDRCRDLQRLI